MSFTVTNSTVVETYRIDGRGRCEECCIGYSGWVMWASARVVLARNLLVG